jgi:hypothetical protein
MPDGHKISQDELKREFSAEDAYFRDLDEKRLAAAQQRTRVRKMICRREGMPETGCELQAFEIDGVHVDRCATCDGLWLDAHELEDLRRGTHRKPGLLRSFLNMLVPGQDED